MNKITIILLAVTALVVNLAAQEPITFSDFIAEDGSGIENLLKLQNARADKKEVEQMVKISLGTENLPKLDDTVDSIAIAICHTRSCINQVAVV